MSRRKGPDSALELFARRSLARVALKYAGAHLIGADEDDALEELVDAAKDYHAAITEEPGAGAGFAPRTMLRARAPKARK